MQSLFLLLLFVLLKTLSQILATKGFILTGETGSAVFLASLFVLPRKHFGISLSEHTAPRRSLKL